MTSYRRINEILECLVAYEDNINPLTKKKYTYEEIAKRLHIVKGTLSNVKNKNQGIYEEIKGNFDVRLFRQRELEDRIVEVGNVALNSLELKILSNEFAEWGDISQLFKQLGSVIKDIEEARHKRETTKGEIGMRDNLLSTMKNGKKL